MKNTEISKEIEAAETKLRELRERLAREEAQPDWEEGDVFKDTQGFLFVQYHDGQAYVGKCAEIHPNERDPYLDSSPTRLGTFNEVFVERSKIKDEYVKKSDITIKGNPLW